MKTKQRHFNLMILIAGLASSLPLLSSCGSGEQQNISETPKPSASHRSPGDQAARSGNTFFVGENNQPLFNEATKLGLIRALLNETSLTIH